MWISVFFLAFLVTSPAAAADECPLDLNYVGTFPWDHSSCVAPASNITACCTTLLSLYGIAFAQRLRLTSLFRLPNATASAACLVDFQSNLSALALPSDLVTTCFPSPQRFVISPDFCAGILTAQNWTAKVGSSSLDFACRPDLSVFTPFFACLNAGFSVTSQLTSLDGNASHATNCFYLTVIYAAGVANQYGPEDTRRRLHLWPRPLLPFFPISLQLPRRRHLRPHRRRRRPRSPSLRPRILSPALQIQDEHFFFRKPEVELEFQIPSLAKHRTHFVRYQRIREGHELLLSADGGLVAVKKVLEPDLEGGDEEFRNEVETISHLRHQNLIPLRGCYITDDDDDTTSPTTTTTTSRKAQVFGL